MERDYLDLDESSSPGGWVNPQLARMLALQSSIQSLADACKCHEDNCRVPSWKMMKRIVKHTKVCTRKTKGDCRKCQHLVRLCCYHAKHCQKTECPVPFCISVKRKLNTLGWASPPPAKPATHALAHDVQNTLQQIAQNQQQAVSGVDPVGDVGVGNVGVGNVPQQPQQQRMPPQ